MSLKVSEFWKLPMICWPSLKKIHWIGCLITETITSYASSQPTLMRKLVRLIGSPLLAQWGKNMPESLSLLVVVFVIGILAGTAINAVVAWLPPYLYRQWERDARDILGLSVDHPALPGFNNLHSAARRTLVVIACGLLSVGVVHHCGFTLEGLAFIVLTWSLIAASLVDADHKILPDMIVLPLVWAGLIVNSFGFYTTSSAALWGAIGGYMSLWIVSWLFRLVAGKEGIGHGDFKLVSVFGAWGGWQVLPFTVFLAASLGVLVYSLTRFLSVRSTMDSAVVPFGPYISAAGWIVMLYSMNAVSLPLY